MELRAAGEMVVQSGLLELLKFKNQNHISKIIPACPALVLFSLFFSNSVWIKGRNEAGATVRVCVSIDLMGNSGLQS